MEHAMVALKVSQIGNSLGVILPKEVLAELKVRKGDALMVSILPGGVKLSRYDDDIAKQIEAGREVARDYRDTLRALAK
jgi:putative addiction module antidote